MHPEENFSSGLQAEWARLLMSSLADAGVRDVVISPGSRSTPWLLAALDEDRFTCHAIADERSAAFFALGLAKAAERASLLLCTSGSAAAHYFPAIVEAAASYTPLLILTADRPIELQAAGANQTIDQIKLYGDHVRQFFDLGSAEESVAALRGARRLVAQAWARTLGPEPGPVHLNARARKPLEPQREQHPAALALRAEVDGLLRQPCPRLDQPMRLPPEKVLERLLRAIVECERPLLVAGPGQISQGGWRQLAHELCRRIEAPLLADGTSQVRFGEERPASVIDTYGAFLGSGAFDEPGPDLILQFGNPLTTTAWSKYLERLLEKNGGGPQYWVLAPWGWRDGDNVATELLQADLEPLLEILLERLPCSRRPSAWERRWQEADGLIRAELAAMAAAAPLSEGALVRAVVEALPAGAMLAIGNSLPIRELDLWSQGERGELVVLSQRGASGIDGLVSSAAGAARLLGRPSLLLLGDISLGHDLSGLELLGRLSTPLVVLVFNNQGGRIFEQLPLATHSSAAGRMDYWTTPHERDFEAAARHFGVAYARIDEPDGLAGVLDRAFYETGKSILIEARLPPHGAAEQNAELRRRVASRLAELPGEAEAGERRSPA